MSVEEPRLGSRLAARFALDAVVEARSGQVRSSLQVVDLSRTGARLKTLSPLRLGNTLWLKLPMLEALQVKVVWVNGVLAGCLFEQPLHEAVFRNLVAAGRAAAAEGAELAAS